MSEEEIKKAASEAITWKGYPFSQTEFDCHYASVFRNLEKKGATKDQIKKFKELVDSAPVRGGRFNPYSGD